jgi:hypothetical protein
MLEYALSKQNGYFVIYLVLKEFFKVSLITDRSRGTQTQQTNARASQNKNVKLVDASVI